MQSKPNFFQKPINERWQITNKLKSGGFGSVYLALELNNKKKQYAIKMIPAERFRYAEIEQKMYALVQKQQFTNGFVKYYETGEFMKYKYLLMELIGKDLDQLKKITQKQQFTLKTVLMIGLQVVDRLQALHKIGYLHRDVKPDNLAIGLAEKNKVIYLFDFGLALPIGQEIPKEEKGKVVGTLGFMSCRAHEGKQQGPSDDLQSLIYTLIYLALGSLPWQKLKVQSTADFHKILLMKRDFARKHSKGECRELIEILAWLQNTKAEEKVDYLKIKFKMLEAMKKRQMQNDFIFEWCGKTDRLSSPSKEKKKPDSPIKNQMIEFMNEQNQQLVQNEIYEVYKFIEANNKNKLNKHSPTTKSPIRNQPYRQQVSKAKLEQTTPQLEQTKQKLEQRKEQNKRPASAVLNPSPLQKQWEKIMLLEKSNFVSGPKIVINKTAKHKI